MNKNVLIVSCLFLSTALLGQIPTNDDCSDAISIGEVDDLPFSNLDATTDGPFHVNSPCPGTGPVDSFYNDIWYQYTPDYNGHALWTLCGSADFDTKIAVYRPGSACPPQDEDLMTCNEDAGGCAGATSELLFPVDSAQTYLLRLAGFGEDAPGEEGSGTFSIGEFKSSLENDFCEDAITVALGLGQSFSTTEATTDGPNHPGNGACFGFGDISAQKDAWFVYTADFTGTVEWSSCNGILFDSRLAVYGPDRTCPLKDEDLYACNDDGTGCMNYSSRVVFDVVEGSQYHLRIGGFDGETGSGTFDLQEVVPPPVPANDGCADAQDIFIIDADAADALDTFFFGSTIGAGFDADNFTFPHCLNNTSGGEFAEVWYRFNSLGNEEIELRFDVLTAGASFFIDLWEADCSRLVDTLSIAHACISTPDGADDWRDTFALFPAVPTDYILRVNTRLTSDLPGDFTLQLVADIPTTSAEPFPIADLHFWPNPAGDFLHLQMNVQEQRRVRFKILNTLGQVVKNTEQQLLGGIFSKTLDLRSLQPALYFLYVETVDGAQAFRFLKR